MLITSELIPQSKYLESPKLFLEKLQEHLRIMKSQQTRDFYKLYEFKSNLSESSPVNEAETIEKFYEYWEVTKPQKSLL